MQKKNQTPIDNKLTLVSVSRNGRTHSFFIKLPIYKKEKAVVANVLAAAQVQFLATNSKAKYIADGAVISAMNELAQALPI